MMGKRIRGACGFRTGRVACQAGDLGVLRGFADRPVEQARTRKFASLASASYAFIRYDIVL